MKKSIIGLSLLTLGLAGTAYAAQTMQHPDPLGDKTMTKAEFMAKGDDMFAQMDVNHDGKLDQADRAAHEGQRFDMLDANHDGALSRAEFMAARPHGGDDMGNEDGGAERGQHRGGRHGGQGGGHGGKMMQKMADANQDGSVSKDEFLAAHAKHFDVVDTNHDGQLTKAERQTAHQKMRAIGGMPDAGMMAAPPAPAT